MPKSAVLRKTDVKQGKKSAKTPAKKKPQLKVVKPAARKAAPAKKPELKKAPAPVKKLARSLAMYVKNPATSATDAIRPIG